MSEIKVDDVTTWIMPEEPPYISPFDWNMGSAWPSDEYFRKQEEVRNEMLERNIPVVGVGGGLVSVMIGGTLLSKLPDHMNSIDTLLTKGTACLALGSGVIAMCACFRPAIDEVDHKWQTWKHKHTLDNRGKV